MVLNTPSLLWFLAGIVLLLLEMSVPGFVLFFFAAGAWITALSSWLFPLTLNGQILVFIVSSLISLFALRRLVKKVFTGRSGTEGEDSALAPAGERVVVVQDIIPPTEGKVKYSGTTWRAEADTPLHAGEIAEIVAQDGLRMKVRRADGEL